MSTAISRRMLLRGFGAAMALPWLDQMAPVANAAAATGKPPVRMAFLYVPNGVNVEKWRPQGEGADWQLSPTLSALKDVKSEVTALSGLTLRGAFALGDGGGDHARSVAAYLTGSHPKKTDGADISNAISVDQYAAAQIGFQTRFPSLELGCSPSAQSGRCDSGYSCAYSSNMSWRNSTSHVGKEINPQAAFDRLFGNENAKESAESRALRHKRKKSILDFVMDDAKRLNQKLGKSDQRKLDEYLFAVREIERRVQQSIKLDGVEVDVPDYPRPDGVPADFGEHARLMMDMMVLAFQTDTTRVSTFMFTNAGSNRTYGDIGVREGHHSLSHHKGSKKNLEKIAKIDAFHVEQYAYFVKELQKVREGDGTLLDNCMVMYGSGISDGNRHNHDDLPIIMAGRGGGAITPNRHLIYPDNTPLTNLYVSMLNIVGAKADRFGDSNGKITNLG
ncbi:DUF1552 domain-containing protein [Blastopirellula retiformator]|uniref:DUF1552 domain-containing protein n=1 Tax=Blastopirellula retiformator TaxID=2527970 RepID=A0A5C5UVB9_9BACT|nr:DUF1552 domain-containing protein [Blastopirellula retiformator]TWT29523.1 hypothetical protein Enr8_50400 [Blastopirellula retiformator]